MNTKAYLSDYNNYQSDLAKQIKKAQEKFITQFKDSQTIYNKNYSKDEVQRRIEQASIIEMVCDKLRQDYIYVFFKDPNFRLAFIVASPYLTQQEYQNHENKRTEENKAADVNQSIFHKKIEELTDFAEFLNQNPRFCWPLRLLDSPQVIIDALKCSFYRLVRINLAFKCK